jgi:mono/diheme cytochrome c family protein
MEHSFRPRWSLLPLLATLLLVDACHKRRAPKPRVSALPPQARAEALEIFTSRCAACHGSSGEGDGPTSGALEPKPPDFHDAAWQESLTDAEIEKSIVKGGASVKRSMMMPSNADLASKPATVSALRELIRDFCDR